MPAKQSVNHVRQAEYARLRGLSAARVSQLKTEGRLVLDAFGMVDVAATDRLLGAVTDPRGGDRTGKAERAHEARLGKADPLRSARIRRESANAEIAEIQAARARGELVPAADVTRAAIHIATITRAEVEGIADRIAHQLLGVADEAEIHSRLFGECENALRRISDASAHAVSDAIATPDQGNLDLLHNDAAAPTS